MKKIKIFLASSKELNAERAAFEREIYRKCKAWFERGTFLHLDIWEDLSARMSSAGSQSEYNQFVREADLFVLLAHTKLGMYTDEEFEQAFGQFQATQKPFIFTYFKTADGVATEPSLAAFKQKLADLNHFYAEVDSADSLWNQFNKELERLEEANFLEWRRADAATSTRSIVQGDKSVYIEKGGNISFNIQ
jgi:hydroxymethylpyrimidine pyrophosphatase-like HAD family hydrolase